MSPQDFVKNCLLRHSLLGNMPRNTLLELQGDIPDIRYKYQKEALYEGVTYEGEG